MSARRLPRLVLMMLALSLAGCATHYQPRYGHDGVYYDRPVAHYRAVHPDPLLYPYWSLDYFYFSRYYHPYSVLVGYYDPWYYPYPGWYYGYRAGPRTRLTISYGGYWYPWYGYTAPYYYDQPWRPRHVYYPRHTHPGWAHQPRVRQIDERLREMERRERPASTALRDPSIDSDRLSAQRSDSDQRRNRAERSPDNRLRRAGQRDPAPVRIPRREAPVLRPAAPPTRSQPPARSRTIERSGAPIERQVGQPPHRTGVPEVRAPRHQAPERSAPPPRQSLPRQQPLPPARTTPVSPPPSQPAPPPQRQSSPPPRRSEGQRSAPRRERQRER